MTTGAGLYQYLSVIEAVAYGTDSCCRPPDFIDEGYFNPLIFLIAAQIIMASFNETIYIILTINKSQA